MKTGIAMAKQVAGQTASNTGKQMAKSGFHVATKEVVTQSVSNTGQQVVKTGVREATKEVVTETVSKTGQEVVKTGTRTTTKEIVTETSVVNESFGGLAIAAAVEGVSAVYDISCAYKDKQEGRISQAEFDQAVGKRVVTGTMNVAGSTLGAAIGQVLIPIPVVGGLVGGIGGSFLGKYVGGLPFS